ncbi:MAG TPA: acyl-CoA thioesterase [Polyangiaceae bacterium]|jgi:acyl-CoA thioester hydrolase|nr:acyl-CoA thioesterase [Polyangiaceae bacterium]
MTATVHEYPLLILERHLDTFGHVNNATYLDLFEEARWDLITRGGYGIERIRQTRQGPVALECSVRFKRELVSRVKVTIATSMVSYVGKIGRMHQEMRLADGSVACDADFTLGLFDLERRKLLEPTPAWLTSLGLAPEDWQPSGARGPGL